MFAPPAITPRSRPTALPVAVLPMAALVLSPLLALMLLLVLFLPPAATRAASSYELEARYDVAVHLEWDTRRVRVRTNIDLRNTSGAPVDRLDLNTTAAKLGGLRGLRVEVDGVPAAASVRGQTIRLPLRSALAEDETAVVGITYRARLGTSAGARGYFFARLDGVAQLYRFIPWLSRPIPFGSSGHGEPFVTPVSPRVEVAVSSDRRLVWATSGRRVARLGPKSARYVARNVRDFNLAASPAWTTARGTSRDGRTAIVAHARIHDARRLVTLARAELARYQAKTGVAYPHPSYTIAETGGGLAMESPALVWIPAARPASDLPYLVSHETAHQWWYSTVGNDQSTDAFADEAMADYFARKAHLSIRSSRCRMDRLDREIRAYSDVCYYEVIYVQGARFLDNLRKDFGSARFKTAIRRYTRDHRFEIGSNARLLEALRDEMGERVLKRYHSRFPSLY